MKYQIHDHYFLLKDGDRQFRRYESHDWREVINGAETKVCECAELESVYGDFLAGEPHITECEAAQSKSEVSTRQKPNKSERELPYVFDLLWDVKSYEQVERIAKHQGDCSDASPEDLVELFQQENLEIPECLKAFAPQQTIWVCRDGTWLPYEPLFDEAHKYRKTRITGFKETKK